jgi:chromosomal replication initiation ATPase DnaA
LTLSPGVIPYLLSHFQRDMRSLSTMLDSLDQYSLETQRPITLPLLREWLQAEAKNDESRPFDLDHTLLPIDSDYEWGQFMARIGAVDAAEFARR